MGAESLSSRPAPLLGPWGPLGMKGAGALLVLGSGTSPYTVS